MKTNNAKLVPTKLKIEPRYVEYTEGPEEDGLGGLKRPKWQSPSTDFQRTFLSAVGRKYYQTKNERSAVIAIEKSQLFLESGLVSVYPAEWVQNCVDWAIRKRMEGYFVQLNGLINLINDKDKRTQFTAKWQKDHPVVKLQMQITTEPLPDVKENEDWKKFLE